MGLGEIIFGTGGNVVWEQYWCRSAVCFTAVVLLVWCADRGGVELFKHMLGCVVEETGFCGQGHWSCMSASCMGLWEYRGIASGLWILSVLWVAGSGGVYF